MFIDDSYNDILNIITHNDPKLQHSEILTDAIASEITCVIEKFYPVNDVIHTCSDKNVVFPQHSWYEWQVRDGSYMGVLSSMLLRKDPRLIRKTFMKALKNNAQGKTRGVFSKRKPKLGLASTIHTLIFITKDLKKDSTPFLIGRTQRLLTKDYFELGRVIEIPNKEANAHTVMMQIDLERIFEAQLALNSTNNTIIKTNYMAKHVAKNVVQPTGDTYKLLTVKRNRIILKPSTNLRNTGSRQRYHTRRGHDRRLRQKDGTIKKIWINSYHAGDKGLGVIHKDYKL